MILQEPWVRVKDPTPVPAGVDEDMLLALPEAAFAELLRDNLVPRGPETRGPWERLWEVLVRSDDLAERAYDVLEGFLDAINDLRASGEADENALRRAAKFERFVNDSWSRLDTTERPQASKANMLVHAITKHRAMKSDRGETITRADEELWDWLGRTGLDPTS